ncbi:diguanylate cyclase [Qipengyuania flava]|uniref:diguanylate cyclase n=1 Tax=Qipengyuania flava TaxID=192812 RepID=A0A5P6NBT4_9SPHN|nr:diguanylate cyclase [Qipengyuania flava]QFI63514.1 diguanylate cyclase [Qipengyuania flava]
MWVIRQFTARSFRSDWRSYFLIGCVIVLALLLAGASWSAWRSSVERSAAEQRQDHTLQVLIETDRLRSAALQQIRGGRGYLLTGRQMFLRPHISGKRQAEMAHARLANLLADNPQQVLRVKALGTDLAHLRLVVDSMVARASEGRQADALQLMRSGSDRDAIEAIMRTLDALQASERAELAQRTATAKQRAIANERYQYLLAAIGLLLLALSIVTTIYVRRALERERLARRELQHFAMTDALTALPNRRSFMKELDRAIERAQAKPDRTLSLAIFDIDHFKRINDRFGHPAGDAVIKDVGKRAKQALRKRDLVGRIGGEEFGVILPNANLAAATAICERLRQAIAGNPVVREDAIIAFTASIGIAEFQAGDEADHLLTRADVALYDAKTGGRNQVRTGI